MADDIRKAGPVGDTIDVRASRWRAPHLPGRGRDPVPAADQLEQFVPLLMDYFGRPWWQHGSVSLRFVSTTLGEEPVCAYLERESPDHCRVWLHAEGEALIARGTASLGEDPRSELRRALAAPPATASAAPPLLHDVEPGRESGRVPVGIGADEVDARLPYTLEPMACYRQADEFGARVVPPSLLIAAAQAVEADLLPGDPTGERLTGGLELCYLAGPMLCDRDYRLQGKVLAVEPRQREELLWYQAELSDGDGRAVAQVLRLEHFGREGVTLAHAHLD